MGYIADAVAVYPGGLKAFKTADRSKRMEFLRLQYPEKSDNSLMKACSIYLHPPKRKKPRKKPTPKLTKPAQNTPYLTPLPQVDPTYSPPNEALMSGGVTEELIETALVQALVQDPVKVIGHAINWLDKKNGIKREDIDNEEISEKMNEHYQEALQHIYRKKQ